jgi:hypothetical protein
LWRRRRDAFHPAGVDASQDDKLSADRQLLRAVEYVEKQADGR